MTLREEENHFKYNLANKIESTDDIRLLMLLNYIIDNWESKNYIDKMSIAELRQLV